jgi:hypothetical protein
VQIGCEVSIKIRGIGVVVDGPATWEPQEDELAPVKRIPC